LKEVVVRLAGEADAVPAARRAVQELDPELDPELLTSVSLLVSELVTNSIRHAETTTPASIELQARVLADRVRVEVRDRGPGFEPKPQAPHRRSRSGWGL